HQQRGRGDRRVAGGLLGQALAGGVRPVQVVAGVHGGLVDGGGGAAQGGPGVEVLRVGVDGEEEQSSGGAAQDEGGGDGFRPFGGGRGGHQASPPMVRTAGRIPGSSVVASGPGAVLCACCASLITRHRPIVSSTSVSATSDVALVMADAASSSRKSVRSSWSRCFAHGMAGG